VHAQGTFDIDSELEPPYDELEGVVLARATIDKRFAGPLIATSRVHMLGARTPGQGAAYVALERITGALDGRRGSFVVTHVGVIDRGASSLTIAIVPDSGTGELAGIAGSMTIEIIDKQHHYGIDYTLP
jgi:hypothetical protein